MTIEELKTEAEKLGYRVVKKEKYVSLLPCPCGRKKPEKWYSFTENEDFYQCPNCGLKAPGAMTDKQARYNWNLLVHTTQN
jgi:predicted RNA-binding Zn-ribbon protein involved in translation (DUF1610 family)